MSVQDDIKTLSTIHKQAAASIVNSINDAARKAADKIKSNTGK